MEWAQIIEIILGAGLLGGIIRLIFVSGKMTQQIKDLVVDSKEIKNDINQINMRLSRLEGSFYERGYWESRKTGNDHHKKR